MNTPEPCVNCKHLYWDCMQEEDVFYMAECRLGLPMGREECTRFHLYSEPDSGTAGDGGEEKK